MESCWDIAMEWSPETQVKIGQYVASHPYRLKNKSKIHDDIFERNRHTTLAEYEKRSLFSPDEGEIQRHEASAAKLQRKISSRLNRNERILLRLKHKAMRRAGQEVPKVNYYDNDLYTHKNKVTTGDMSTDWHPYQKFEYKDSTVAPKISRPNLKVLKGGGRNIPSVTPSKLKVARG